MNKILIYLLASSLTLNCFAQNKLTKKEKKEGWKLLFDGKTTKGWHNFNKKTIGSSWRVVDGMLHLDTSEMNGWQTKDGGDIVTEESFTNYEFSVDYKISKNGNSGIIFNVKEDTTLQYVWYSGPEMQIADPGHPDAKIFKHAAGDLYDLIPSTKIMIKADEQWNNAKIKNDRGLLQLFLNGEKVVETRIDGQEWKDLIANSKFKKMPYFGKFLGGKLSLQDHGNAVWFKNIKIRKL